MSTLFLISRVIYRKCPYVQMKFCIFLFSQCYAYTLLGFRHKNTFGWVQENVPVWLKTSVLVATTMN